MDQTLLMKRRCERKPFRSDSAVDVLGCLLFQLVRSSNLTWQEEVRAGDSWALVFCFRQFRPAKRRGQGCAYIGSVGHRRSTLSISLPQHQRWRQAVRREERCACGNRDDEGFKRQWFPNIVVCQERGKINSP